MEIRNIKEKYWDVIDEEERVLLYILTARIVALIVVLFNFTTITNNFMIICALTIVTVLELIVYDKKRILKPINLSAFIFVDINVLLAYFTREIFISDVLNTITLLILIVYFIINTYYCMRYVWRKMYKTEENNVEKLH